MATDSNDFEALAAQVRATVDDCGLGHILSVGVVEDGHPRLRVSWPVRDGRSDAIDFPADVEWVDRVCRLVRALRYNDGDSHGRAFDPHPAPGDRPLPAVVD